MNKDQKLIAEAYEQVLTSEAGFIDKIKTVAKGITSGTKDTMTPEDFKKKLEQAHEKVLKEFLGFGKKKDDEHMVGVKYTNLLAKGLLAKGFKKRNAEGGAQFVKDNGHGMTITVSMGGDYKETPVSVLVKPGYGKEFYKTWTFTAHDVAFPYRGDVSKADFSDRKKWSEESQEWEEQQRKKVGQIYDIVQAFEDVDLKKIEELVK